MADEPWFSRVRRRSSTLFDIGAVLLTVLWLVQGQQGNEVALKVLLLTERGVRLVLALVAAIGRQNR